jgi:hypothetical protein
LSSRPVISLDEARAKSAVANEPPPWQRVASELARVATSLARELILARRALAAAEAERAELAQRVAELQTWVDDAGRFEAVEQLQLGRLLALQAQERRRPRRGWKFSLVTVILLVYAVAAAGLAWLLLVDRI